ncbi:MAG: methyltransferase domain-containing protein [Chloroflexi bacterium]|nr:MAG: methyltransferase domain-containing protein [Chloroflexota bacterium]
MPSSDAARIFSGIGSTYERAGSVLSFGQDPRWRRALVGSIKAAPGETVLDVATGTGLVARELISRYGCRVIGLDQSADMLRAAAANDGHIPLVRGLAERLPFPDASFDHLTFTYLLRYVDDPAATMRELARVVKPGGRIGMVEFALPTGPLRWAWRLWTRVGLPLGGLLFSKKWSAVGAFLGPSIERFYKHHTEREVERYWRDAGLCDVRSARMSLGGGVVMTGTRAGATEGPRATEGSPPDLGWTLLHPPYTLWHLSYVLLGASLSPAPDARIVAGALLAFFLGVGVAAHSFDELQGRPLGTRIPTAALVAFGAVALASAIALGIVAAFQLGLWLLAFVAVGAALVVLYGLEAPIIHSDMGFALGWGGFPVLTAAVATGAPVAPAIVVAIAASLLSLAQRRLSTPVRRIRRKARDVTGTITFRDGTTEALDRRALIAAPEGALRLLWLATVALSIGLLLVRWAG